MQKNNSNTGLTIIKASAGSGKTHKLTYEYLKMVVSRPSVFKHILAVTFTNKATAEMKSRIISELQKLASGNQNSNMLEPLAADTQLSREEIQTRAKKLAGTLLHEYAHFSMSTIDHFFQSIIRALTRELSLSGGYNIQIDETAIIEEAVEKFLKDLRKNSEYMQVMLDFIDAQMSDEKSWNVQRQLVAFARELFREHVRYYYVKNNGSLTGKVTSAQIIQKLNTIIGDFKKKINLWAKELNQFIEKHELAPEDFKGKTRNPLHSVLSKIEKRAYADLPDKLEKLQGLDQWGHPDSENGAFVNSLGTFFDQKTEELEKLITNDFNKYLEAIALYKNIFQHSLATGLMDKVSEVLTEQNFFLLADAPVLLGLFTHGNDTPFVYEKTGHRYRHFMIDEFQDTSALQWENFRPLIEESLASGNRGNFIVGDVKQAIYRWRNGDWSLLHKKVAQQIKDTQTVTLQNNWRSRENIVAFNNVFFRETIETVSLSQEEHYAHELKAMYADVEQTIPENVKENRKGGYIHIESVEGGTVNEFRQEALERVKMQIEKLKLEHNQDDICVLVRRNHELKEVASFLINETNFNIISSGSLSMGSSQLAQTIITAFRFITDPQDLYLKTIAYLCRNKHESTDLHDIFTNKHGKHVPEAFLNRTKELSNLSALDLIGEIVETLDLKNRFPNQDVFLSRLYNEIKKLIFDKGSNLPAVIDWWDTEGINLSIEMPDTASDHIRIMTIHKSKGLQFSHVLLPFAQWYPGAQLDLLWLLGDAFSLEELQGGLFPAKLSKSHTANPNLKQFHDAESFAMLVDQINMLYVANTRAKDGLYMFYQQKPKNKSDVSAWIKSWIENESYSELKAETHFVAENILAIGSPAISKPQATKTKQHLEITVHKSRYIAIKSNIGSILQTPGQTRLEQREKGSMLHRLFEQILTPSDIQSAVNKLVYNGQINKDDAEKLADQIKKWIDTPEVEEWFSPRAKILTESDIILPRQESKRPDRVVMYPEKTIIIDYKFGQELSSKHKKQVREYGNLFNEMGYKNVSGFVWYPFLNKIDPAFA